MFFFQSTESLAVFTLIVFFGFRELKVLRLKVGGFKVELIRLPACQFLRRLNRSGRWGRGGGRRRGRCTFALLSHCRCEILVYVWYDVRLFKPTALSVLDGNIRYGSLLEIGASWRFARLGLRTLSSRLRGLWDLSLRVARAR